MTTNKFKCNCCDKSFQTIQAMNSHISGAQRRHQADTKYLENPNRCKLCDAIIPRRSKNIFCSKSCGAKYNNTGRIRTTASKQKVSKILRGRKHHNGNGKPYCDIKYVNCKICDNIIALSIQSSRMTCSEDCRVIASTTKGSFNNQKKQFFTILNPTDNKSVTLESTWEKQLADEFISQGIKWIRPKFIPWTDSTGKTRRYFPDFYLLDYDIYVDPKNPYLMKLDDEKLSEVRKTIRLLAGDVSDILLELKAIIGTKRE